MRSSDWSSDVCSSDLYVHSDTAVQALFPVSRPRVFVTHTRPEPFLGALRRLDTGPATTAALGFVNRGGTLDVPGLLFANRSTWAHVVDAAAHVLGQSRGSLLSDAELAAVDGQIGRAHVGTTGTNA